MYVCLHMWLYLLVSLWEYMCLYVCTCVSMCLYVCECVCAHVQRTDGSFGFLDLALDRGASHSYVDAGNYSQVLHQESKCSEALRPRCSSSYPNASQTKRHNYQHSHGRPGNAIKQKPNAHWKLSVTRRCTDHIQVSIKELESFKLYSPKTMENREKLWVCMYVEGGVFPNSWK